MVGGAGTKCRPACHQIWCLRVAIHSQATSSVFTPWTLLESGQSCHCLASVRCEDGHCFVVPGIGCVGCLQPHLAPAAVSPESMHSSVIWLRCSSRICRPWHHFGPLFPHRRVTVDPQKAGEGLVVAEMATIPCKTSSLHAGDPEMTLHHLPIGTSPMAVHLDRQLVEEQVAPMARLILQAWQKTQELPGHKSKGHLAMIAPPASNDSVKS